MYMNWGIRKGVMGQYICNNTPSVPDLRNMTNQAKNKRKEIRETAIKHIYLFDFVFKHVIQSKNFTSLLPSFLSSIPYAFEQFLDPRLMYIEPSL